MWKHKYLKYKAKYLELKKLQYNMVGGNDDSHLENLESHEKNSTEKISKRPLPPKVNDSMSKNIAKIIADSVEPINRMIEMNNQPLSDTMDLESDEDTLYSYLKKHNIPLISYSEKVTEEQLQKNYNIRRKVNDMTKDTMYTVMGEIVDFFNIKQLQDIEKVYNSSIFGYMTNYIVGYMVLLAYLIKNKIQLNSKEAQLSFLKPSTLYSNMVERENDDEMIPFLVDMIQQYVFTVPIKKLVSIRYPIDKNKTALIPDKTKIVLTTYDAKNDVVYYDNGDMKETVKLNWRELVLLIQSIFSFPVFKQMEHSTVQSTSESL
jgi:hypothetical protein